MARKSVVKSAVAAGKFAVMAVAGLLAVGGQTRAADLSSPLTGNLLGSVVDKGGVPQMGASVQLFNKYERLLSKTLTTPDGRFVFAGLPIDVYSVRVSLASFLPASRDRILVKAGLDSNLQIHLATLFSSVELTYTIPAGAMSDDWRWVLRSSPSTRLVTRFLPDQDSVWQSAGVQSKIFSGTHAMLLLSGGDGGFIDSDSAQSDLGTGFVLSTNIFGRNQLRLGGALGQTVAFAPAAMALFAIYSRSGSAGIGEPPEVTLTVSQLGFGNTELPGGQSVPVLASVGAVPTVIRAMSLSVYQVSDPSANLHIEYGMTGEAVEFVQHTSRVSPFARVTADLGSFGQMVVAYSDGGRPDQLIAHKRGQESVESGQVSPDDMSTAAETLSKLPEFSSRNGRLELQRSRNMEVGYRKVQGTHTLAISGFSEDVSNGRLNVAGDISGLGSQELVSDGSSKTSAYNIGSYKRTGYLASVTQTVDDSLKLAIAYGRMGGFASGSTNAAGSGRILSQKDFNVATVNVDAKAPLTHTRISANYGWTDTGAVMPRHTFTTQSTYVSPGLNLLFHQPLPSFFGLPGRIELTADLRNLLAQGYLPLSTGDGRKLLAVQTPRAIRGGVNIVF